MTAAEVHAVVQDAARRATTAQVTQASQHGPVRIWRETTDRRTGQVTRERPVELSPLTLAMNRLYTGFGLAMSRHRATRSEPRRRTSKK